MKIVVLESVKELVDTLEFSVQTDIKQLILLLEQYGHTLSMPQEIELALKRFGTYCK